MTAGLRVERVTQPDLGLLRDLGAFDSEAFGDTGLRSFDIGVFCRLGACLRRPGGAVTSSGPASWSAPWTNPISCT